MSIASSKASFPKNAIQYVLSQFSVPITSLRQVNSWFLLLPCLPVTFILLQKLFNAVPVPNVTDSVTLPLCYGMKEIFPSWLYAILLSFAHDRSNWSSPSFSNTTHQNFLSTIDLLFEVSTFQHYTELRSKYNIWLVCFLNLNLIWWWVLLFVTDVILCVLLLLFVILLHK
jgi:hypothetical protein